MIDLFTANENPTMSNFNKRITQVNAGTFAAYPSATVAQSALISVDDGADNVPIKSLSVAVEPVQSGSPSPSNPQTISGWNAINVSRTGVNVWDEEWEVGNYSSTTGEKTSANTRIRCKNPIPVKPSTAYFFAAPAGTRNQWFEYGADGSFFGAYSFNGGNFTVGANTYYITFTMAQGYGTTYNNDVSINYPATDTEYHVYQGKTYSFPFQTTTYGGTFSLTYDGEWTASMVVDRVIYNLSNSIFNWGTTTWGGWRTGSSLSWIESNASMDRYCAENYPQEAYSAVRGGTYGMAVGDNGSNPKRVYVYTGDTTNAPSGQAVFPTINTTTVSWTQDELLTILGADGFTTLLGINNVWSDAGDVGMTYRQDINILLSRLTALIGG